MASFKDGSAFQDLGHDLGRNLGQNLGRDLSEDLGQDHVRTYVRTYVRTSIFSRSARPDRSQIRDRTDLDLDRTGFEQQKDQRIYGSKGLLV